ncbi:MAG: putative transporter [Bacteroidales bacterium]|nr:putative transporter [Bacteroidales bacterium]
MHDLFFSSGTGHSMMVLAFVIGFGLLLGKIKFKGVSLGPIWILFVGILFSALGVRTDALFLHFIKEFGLVLFVFAIGLQVGPSFFHSFHKAGLKLNLLSVLMILLGVGCVLLLYATTQMDLPALVGTMTGAVTNTPGLGTAQQTFYDTVHGTFLAEVDFPQVASRIANAYAVAYPIGILGTMLALVVLRHIFRVDLKQEREKSEGADAGEQVVSRLFVVTNPAVAGHRLQQVCANIEGTHVLTRVVRDGEAVPVADNPELQMGDCVELELQRKDVKVVRIIFGEEAGERQEQPQTATEEQSHTRLTVTKRSLNGKMLRDLDIPGRFGVTVTRLERSGLELVARDNLYLQMGDVLKVVGPAEAVDRFAAFVGNSNRDLDRPNLIPIFLGIGLGLIAGAIPFHFPALPHAVHLGIAGGTLLVAILLGHFGPKWKINTYTTTSANRMLREVGLCLLLATVGLGAGGSFVEACAQDGLSWMLAAVLIVMLPALVTGLLARWVFHLDFYQICGLICGSATNSTVLAFTEENFKSGRASFSYATVFPLALFLQVLAAQLLILLAA